MGGDGSIACLWEGESGETRTLTFAELQSEANRVANALAALGIGPGDRVALAMPMVPEILSILYGCFQIGAIVVPIFAGFGSGAIATRLRIRERACSSRPTTWNAAARRCRCWRRRSSDCLRPSNEWWYCVTVAGDTVGTFGGHDLEDFWRINPRPLPSPGSIPKRARSSSILPAPRASRKAQCIRMPELWRKWARRSGWHSITATTTASSGSPTSAG